MPSNLKHNLSIMKTDNSIKNITGQIATGKNFFGRAKEEKDGWRLIKEEKKSLMLADSRRVGKSSFAYKMIDKAKEEKWNYVFCDMRGCGDEEALYNKFIAELEKNRQYKKTGGKWKLEEIELAPQVLGNRLGAVKWKRQQKNTSRINNIYSNLYKMLDHKKDTLIVFDELIIFLNHLKGNDNEYLNDAILFIEWLESMRKQPDSKIRWIICSSLSIDDFTLTHSIDGKMEDLCRFAIDELKGNEPVEFIRALAKSYKLNLSEESERCMLDKLGWYLPYFIQLLFHEVRNLNTVNIFPETIEEAYKNLLTVSQKQKHFKTWIEHLNTLSKDEKKYAQIILEALSKRQNGSSLNTLKLLIVNVTKRNEDVDEILKYILEKLEKGGYIMKKKETYLFRSPLLKDFWYNTFVKK